MRTSGRLKLPGSDTWRDITGVQYVSAVRPAFLWNVRLSVGPAWVDVQDRYEACTGHISTRGFGLLPLMSESGIDELSITQLVRWSGLAVMAPAALARNPAIEWHEIDANTARAVISDCGLTAQHIFHFDAAGHVIRTESADRYELFPGEGYKPTGSIMLRTDYTQIDGWPVPLGENVIRIEDGREVPFLETRFSNVALHP